MRKRKRLFLFSLVGLLMLVCVIGYSQQVFIGNIHKIWWAEEIKPPYATRTYEVCVLDRVGGTPIIVGDIDVTPTEIEPFTVDISAYSFEVTFGVRTVWIFTEDVTLDYIEYHIGDRSESVWNYSDVNGEFTPNPFVAYLEVVLAPPKGLEHVQ